ncbi:hypothetical protein E2C01_048573 [Portunus trituberculatus]|uniref:Uncharacterized protein n=1 Tax=Portunus trituberculatus TaxID=210409 RepID=A0A5B7G3G2_PORTR|nr:hypothetical protein [Portunus trituberculatus]
MQSHLPYSDGRQASATWKRAEDATMAHVSHAPPHPHSGDGKVLADCRMVPCHNVRPIPIHSTFAVMEEGN